MQYEAQAQGLILFAGRKARELGHSYVGSIHLLLALAQVPGEAGQMLRFAGFDWQTAEMIASVLYGVGTPDLPLPQGFTLQARRVLRGARNEAHQLGCRQVNSAHILLSLLRREKTEAREILNLCNIDIQTLFSDTVDYLKWEKTSPKKQNKEAVGTKLIEQFSEDMLQKAEQPMVKHKHWDCSC